MREPAVADLHDDDQGFAGLVADLTVTLGRVKEALDGQARPRIPWEACHPVGPVGAIQLTAGAGVQDLPDVLGPADGWWWDLRRLALWGFTAGSVTVTKNSAVGSQVGFLSGPGNILWSTQEMLPAPDRLVLSATGIVGAVQWELRAIEVATLWVPEYLM